MKFILDTNFYLHYGFFTECPWKSFFETDELTLLVPLTIIRELDEKKRDLRGHINKRAQKVINRFECIKEGKLSNPLPCGLNMEFTLTKIGTGIDWDSLGLDKSIQDDWIIAEVLSLKNSTNEEIVIVTGDLGLKLKAESVCIPVKRAPDGWMRQIQDPRDKKIMELEQLVKKSYPEVKLYLDGGDKLEEDLQIPIGVDADFDQDVLENTGVIISLLEDEFKEKLSAAKSRVGMPSAFINDGRGFGIYEKKVNIYLRKCIDYLIELKTYSDDCSHTIEIPLVLTNVGGVPAEDIDVLLKFPNDVRIHYRPEKPCEPKSPGEPLTDQEMSLRHSDLVVPRLSILDYLEENTATSRGPTIDKSKNQANYWLKNLKHGCDKSLSIFARFLDGRKPHTFLIEYSIHIANYPNQINDNLKIIPFNNDD